MQAASGIFDIAVIGGGVSGLGAALSALQSGYSVAVLERSELGQATSSASLRIMHGGLRYLQQADFTRVMHSARAQQSLLSDYPDIMQPLRCLMPLKSCGLKSAFPMRCAGALYSLLASQRLRGLPCPRVLSAESVTQEFSSLEALCERGAFEWYDVLLDDPAKLHSRLAEQIRGQGGVIREHCQVSEIRRMGPSFELRAGSEILSCRVVVDTRGPWIDQSLEGETPPAAKAWVKAFNLILRRQPVAHVALGVETAERRLYFLVPRGKGAALGTAYLPFSGDPSERQVSTEQISDFLCGWNAAAPSLAVDQNDIEGIECGILPAETIQPEIRLVGHEHIAERQGYVRVLSTKYTTFQVQGRAVVNVVRRYLRS